MYTGKLAKQDWLAKTIQSCLTVKGVGGIKKHFFSEVPEHAGKIPELHTENRTWPKAVTSATEGQAYLCMHVSERLAQVGTRQHKKENGSNNLVNFPKAGEGLQKRCLDLYSCRFYLNTLHSYSLIFKKPPSENEIKKN